MLAALLLLLLLLSLVVVVVVVIVVDNEYQYCSLQLWCYTSSIRTVAPSLGSYSLFSTSTSHTLSCALGWSGFNERSYEMLRNLTLLVPDLFHMLVSRTLRTQHHGSEQGYIIEETFLQRRDYGIYSNGVAFL